MPIGGADGIGWDETAPPITESAGLGAARIVSTKSSIRQVVAAEHSMSASGGDDQGYHIYGSCRPFYGLQSAVSSSGSDARTMITSDTSRLFGVGSTGTVLLGAGPTALSLGTFPGTTPQRHAWVEEVGISRFTTIPFLDITIPNSGYSGVPYVWVQSVFTLAGGALDAILSVDQSAGASASQFRVFGTLPPASASNLSGQYFHWRSLGTRVL